MKKVYQRNVRLGRMRRVDGGPAPARRWMERVLIANPLVNQALANSAKLCLSALVWPRLVAPYRWELTRQPLPLTVDPIFNGYRILQLTDLHAGKTRLSYLLKVVERCVDEGADLIVLTGDMIDYHPRSLGPLEKVLVKLTARRPHDGILAIFGNHDYHEYSWRHVGPRSAHRAVHKRLAKMLADAGIRVLRNEQYRIQQELPGAIGMEGGGWSGGTAEIVIVGLEEMWTGLADAEKAFRGIGPQEAVICLQHNPDGIDFLMPHFWQYMMCGHSHGGQANFPLMGPIYVPMERREYLRGLFEFPLAEGQPPELGKRRMYVSRGLGHSTPIRLNCPPEATVFTVTAVS